MKLGVGWFKKAVENHGFSPQVLGLPVNGPFNQFWDITLQLHSVSTVQVGPLATESSPSLSHTQSGSRFGRYALPNWFGANGISNPVRFDPVRFHLEVR